MTTALVIALAGPCNGGVVEYGKDGKVIGGKGIAKCEKPQRPYAKEMDLAVKAEVEALENVSSGDLDAKLKTTVVKLTDYSSRGLRDLLLFRICQMSINRGLTNEQTTSLIEKAMGVWDTELKKSNNRSIIGAGQ